MNYTHHYDRLIERARGRKIDGYSERHHVVPKCIGGDNSPGNIVRLTPEEHYVAHQLLVKMHPGNHRLLWAAVNMTGASKKQPGRKNKLYGWLRRLFAKNIGGHNRGRKASPEARAKMSAAKLGKKRAPHSEATKAKMSRASKGVSKSPEHRAASAAAKLGKRRGPNSLEARKRQRNGILKAVNNPSGHAGVYWSKQASKWIARITVAGKKRHLGSFDTPEEGGAAYEAAAREFYA